MGLKALGLLVGLGPRCVPVALGFGLTAMSPWGLGLSLLSTSVTGQLLLYAGVATHGRRPQ